MYYKAFIADERLAWGLDNVGKNCILDLTIKDLISEEHISKLRSVRPGQIGFSLVLETFNVWNSKVLEFEIQRIFQTINTEADKHEKAEI